MPSANRLINEPIPRLIWQITLPVSIGMFFNTMYNVVDTWYGGLISTQALAAMSLSLPVFFILISIGSGLGTGTTALIGSALGADNPAQARQYAAQGISFGILISIVIAAAGQAAAPFLFRLLGADGQYLSICLTYMGVLFKGALFFILVYMLNAILNATGDTRSFRNFLIIGFFLNIGLDPWFIFGGVGVPPLGVAGIALATVLVQLIGVGYLGFRVHRTRILSTPHWREFLPQKEVFRDIARQGFPAGLNIMTIAIGVFVITYFIGIFGEAAVAAYGIGMRVEQIVLLPVIGLNTTTLTLTAQNHGARQHHRVIETHRTALTYGSIAMAIGALLVFFLAAPLVSLFSDDPEVIRIGAGYLKVDAWVFNAYVILFVCVAALQGVKKPMFALYIGLYRQIIAPFALFHLLIRVFATGITGVWWGIFGVTWSAALVALIYSHRVLIKSNQT